MEKIKLNKKTKIAIIGAGISGSCITAALSHFTPNITVYDSNSDAMFEASRYNEGKIHLGYTYAMDQTLKTAIFMADAAMVFSKKMSDWFDFDFSGIFSSSSFNYALHKESILPAFEYRQFIKIHDTYVSSLLRENEYFNVDVTKRSTEIDVTDPYNSETIEAVFSTQEIAVNPQEVAQVIRRHLKKLPIRRFYNHEVVKLIKTHSGYRLSSLYNNEIVEEEYDFVINTSWASLLKINSMLDIQTMSNPLFRSKYYILLKNKTLNIPNTTIVVGKFGDTVNYKTSSLISWYPSGRLHWYQGINPPKIDSIIHCEEIKLEIKRNIIDGISEIFPSILEEFTHDFEIQGNWILAEGSSDVHEKTSTLHKRNQQNIHRHENFISLNPGKYTTAPYVVNQLLQNIRYE